MSDRFDHKPTMTMRDNAGNRLSYKILPRHASLECKGRAPLPYHEVPDTDATRAAHRLIGDTETKQLFMGGLPPHVTLSPVRNELGRMESPLAMLCRAVKERTMR